MRGLQRPYKLLWLYLICECDHSGIWDVELDVVALRLGEDYTATNALDAFGSEIKVINGGLKWFIPSFISFQYGELKPCNRVHVSVLRNLRKYAIDVDPFQIAQQEQVVTIESRDAVLEQVTKQVDLQALPPKPSKPPFKEIVDGFNEHLGKVLTPLQIPTHKRKEAMRIMWQFFKEDIERVNAYWKQVRASKFLTGRSGKSFRASFDWLMNEDNAAKVIEGQYRNEGRGA
ncbi:MAG: hypothetical protein P8R37_12465 [Opitutae bacterium]|nr:hypothetical protein [Opitutae bacterium]